VRSLTGFALVLAACSGGDRSGRPAARTASATPVATGPDALVLRVPRTGGVARVLSYPHTDSVVWTATDSAPPIERVLAFDADAGLVAAVDGRQRPLWFDLRSGGVNVATPRSLRGLTSVDGSMIYGVGVDGAVARFAPSDNWVWKPPAPARAVFPQIGGTLIVLGGVGDAARVWRLYPPNPAARDTAAVPGATGGAGAPLGDQIYLTVGKRTLLGLAARTLTTSDPIEFDHPIRAMAATPSGDRFYVITDSSRTLEIVSRYQNRVSAGVELPGRARDLRVDPFGRYVLVRSAENDSVWVMSVGTDRIVGRLRSAWREDLPFVAPDGTVAVADAGNVVFVDPLAERIVRVSIGGASDFWYAFVWPGFRPRAASLDEPARFPGDSDTTAAAPPSVAAESAAAVPAVSADSVKLGFTLSFAVLLDADKARTRAAAIVVNGQAARVVTGMSGGTAVYRVVLGPYRTRDEAERAGRASGQSYFVYPGSP